MWCSMCNYEGKQQDCFGILRKCNHPQHEYCKDDTIRYHECHDYIRKTKLKLWVEDFIDWNGGTDGIAIAWFIALLLILFIISSFNKVFAEYTICPDKCIKFEESEIDHVETFKIRDKYFLKVVLTNGQDNNFCYGKDYMKLYSDFDDTVELETFKKNITWQEYYRRWDNAVQRN